MARTIQTIIKKSQPKKAPAKTTDTRKKTGGAKTKKTSGRNYTTKKTTKAFVTSARKDKNDPKIQKIAAAALVRSDKEKAARVKKATAAAAAEVATKKKGANVQKKKTASSKTTKTPPKKRASEIQKDVTPTKTKTKSSTKTSKTSASRPKTTTKKKTSTTTKKPQQKQNDKRKSSSIQDENEDEISDDIAITTKPKPTNAKKTSLRLYNLAYAMQSLQRKRPGILKKNLKQIAHMRAMNPSESKVSTSSNDLDTLIGRVGPRIFKQQGLGKLAALSRVSIEKSAKQFMPEMNHIMANIIKRIARGVYLNMLTNDHHHNHTEEGEQSKEKSVSRLGCKIRVLTNHVENGLEDLGYQVHHPSFF